MNCEKSLRTRLAQSQAIEESVLDEFISIFARREIQKDEYLIETGQAVSKVAFICNGIFRAFYTDINGKEINQAFLLEHDFVVSRLKPFSNSLVNIQALEKSSLLVTDMVKLFELADRHHSIATALFKIASMYFDKNQDREVKLRIQDAKENYRYFLKQYPDLIDRIPHYHVASHLHISTTHLSRIRKELASAGKT